MRTDMISICLSVHDENGKYLKYAAITIASVLYDGHTEPITSSRPRSRIPARFMPVSPVFQSVL